MVELVGPSAEAADAGQLPEMAGFDAVLDPGHLFIGGGFPQQPGHLGIGGGFNLSQFMSLGGGHRQNALSRNLGRVVAHIGALGDLLLIDQ